MNLINQYSPMVESIVERANSVQMRNGEQFDTVYWHGSGEAKDGPYEPTGYAKLDALVKAVDPRIMYGGDAAANSVAVFPAELFGLSNEWHFMEMPHVTAFNSPEHYAMVLSHELIHWATIRDPEVPPSGINSEDGAEMREGRKRLPTDYAIDEMAADIGSLLLMKWAGVPNPEEEAMVKRIHATQSHTSPFKPMQEAAMKVAADRALHQFVRLLDMAKVKDEPDYGSDS